MPPNTLITYLDSPEPLIRTKARSLTGGTGLTQAEASSSPLVQALLSERTAAGTIQRKEYHKFCGPHWVLVCLAEIGYPPGDDSLRPMLEQCYEWLLPDGKPKQLQTLNGRVRRCASQESNCLWYSLQLGLADGRAKMLAESLARWQWPDGGWNCDRRPEAVHSSYWESLIPLRALARYAELSGDPSCRAAVESAAELFLKRRLFLRLSDGQPMQADFTRLHYPNFWIYDILFALKVMAEVGRIHDPRCQPALDLLESKRLPGGGFPLEQPTYHTRYPAKSRYSLVDWGPVGKSRANPWVTLDALKVLQAAGRAAPEFESNSEQPQPGDIGDNT